jgi:hypothetical protein
VAITTQAQLDTAIGRATRIGFNKGSVPSGLGLYVTTFRAAWQPAAATAPATASGQTLSRLSVGALPIPAPSGTTYLAAYEGVSSTAGAWLLSDRLVETGALSSIVTTAQTVGSVALPARATGADDVELWLEVYTALGATPSPTVTASYTNHLGVSGRTATLVGGLGVSAPANRMYQMSLQSGDTSVASVQSVTTTTSSGTAGAFGVVLRRSFNFGNVYVPNIGWSQGYAETDLQIIPDDACLELYVLSNSAGSGQLLGSIALVQG